jgi:hypothetical protein
MSAWIDRLKATYLVHRIGAQKPPPLAAMLALWHVIRY